MSYKNIIINLDIMQRKVFDKFNTFSQLQFKPADEVWKYYPKTGARNYNPKTMFNEAPIVETLLLLDYIKTKGLKPTFWYNSSLFIFNDDLYSIVGANKVTKINLTDTIFSSMREAWSHPFFGILEQILVNNGGKLAKPNMQTTENAGCMNKFYALKELFKVRKEYLGDFILPYNIKQNEIPTFINFLKENMGEKVVFKYDCIQEGKGVIFKDLSKNSSTDEITKIMQNNKVKGKEVLITPAYEIDREYRCYFTNHGRSKKVFSIKQRVNSEDIDVFEKENIQIYKNISVKWHEVKTDSDVFKFGSKLTKEMLKYMSYDTGCLEFAKTKDGKIVFFEVNQMAGPLPFEGEDTENMTEFYHSIFEKMLK
ncbi:MAG: hypothetical protein GQ570_09920 [Helicobacteraceae bacterium]|nr:hypothetical protein [Helicobacteraceae bacterium]